MNKTLYWVIVGLLLVFVVSGALVLFEPPQPPADFDVYVLEEYYRSQMTWAAAIGVGVGILLGWHYTRRLYHRPGEPGQVFIRRAAWRGIVAAVIATLVALVFALLMAAASAFGPLAPLEKVLLVPTSGLFMVVLAISAAVAMAVYAVVTRATPWGGQYALIKRF